MNSNDLEEMIKGSKEKKKNTAANVFLVFLIFIVAGVFAVYYYYDHYLGIDLLQEYKDQILKEAEGVIEETTTTTSTTTTKVVSSNTKEVSCSIEDNGITTNIVATFVSNKLTNYEEVININKEIATNYVEIAKCNEELDCKVSNKETSIVKTTILDTKEMPSLIDYIEDIDTIDTNYANYYLKLKNKGYNCIVE